MKIGILTFHWAQNYGAVLQCYALKCKLEELGHDVFIIDRIPQYQGILRDLYHRISYKYFISWLKFSRFNRKYLQPKTKTYRSQEALDRYFHQESLDAIVVGSDQVWRKDMTNTFGLDTFMFSFVPDNVRKYAYAISMGDAQMSFTEEELKTFCFLYNKFDKVSVREDVAQKKLLEMGCYTPYPEQVLDPSMLLSTQDYDFLIEKGATMSQTENKLFCYVLDISDSICEEINLMSSRYGVESVIVTLADGLSIEQWLRNIKDAKMILTDSYHGVVFSLLYNKQFKFIGNKRRGNSRVESLYSFLGVNSEEDLDWNHFNNILKIKRLESLNFLNLL